MTGDNSLEKHTTAFKEKWKNNLIHEHIENMGESEKASIKYFLKTGKVNGSFNIRLHQMLDGYRGEAERTAKLYKALQQISQMSDSGSYERAIVDMKKIATNAVDEFNKVVEF